MTFPTTPAGAFTASVSTISAATANAWRGYFPQALDAVGGGTYANTSAITFSAGSSGWVFGSLVTFNTTSNVTFSGGGTFTINSDPSLFGTMRVGVGAAGGGVRFYATSTLQVDDTVAMSIAGDATWTGASTQVHANLSTDTYSAGSVLAINTASATLGTAATLTVNGAAGGGNTATVAFGQYSTSTYASGATLTVNSGTITNITLGGGGQSGTLAVGATGTLTVTAGAAVTMSVGGGGTTGSITFNADGTLTTTSSAQFTNGGTTTRTGKEVRSGTGAYTASRYYAAPTGSYSVNPLHYDTIERTSAPGSADSITLTPDPGASDTITLTVTYLANSSSTLDVKASGGSTIVAIGPSAPNTNGTVVLQWSGTYWMVLWRVYYTY